MKNTLTMNKFNTSEYSVLINGKDATIYTQQRNANNNGSQNIYCIDVTDSLNEVFKLYIKQKHNAVTDDAMNTILKVLISEQSTIKYL